MQLMQLMLNVSLFLFIFYLLLTCLYFANVVNADSVNVNVPRNF